MWSSLIDCEPELELETGIKVRAVIDMDPVEKVRAEAKVKPV